MTPGHLLRTARRQAGLSQRALARAAGVPPGTVADAERDGANPGAALLEQLLHAAGFELALDRTLPQPCGHLRRYLRVPLAQRLFVAVGGRTLPNLGMLPAWDQLVRLSHRARVEVVGAAAVGVWTPLRTARPVVRVEELAPARPGEPDAVDLLPAWGVLRPGLVPIRTTGSGAVHVLPPLQLAEAVPEHRLALRVAAALLDGSAPRDLGRRRAPAHRDPDPALDHLRVMHTKALVGQPVPRADTFRGWQLDGPVSLRQWLLDNGCNPDGHDAYGYDLD